MFLKANIVCQKPRLLQIHLPYSDESPELQLAQKVPIGIR